MGPIVPALTVALPYITAAVGVYAAVEQREAGQAVKVEKRREAVREADAARGEEIERRRALMSVLAQRSAAAGAAGVETTGSTATLARRDIRDNRNDIDTLNVNTRARQRALRNQGSNAARVGNANALGSLIDTGRDLYNATGGRKKPS